VAEIPRGSRANHASRPLYLTLATAPISRAISAGASIFKGLAGINFGSGTSEGTGFSLTRTGGLY